MNDSDLPPDLAEALRARVQYIAESAAPGEAPGPRLPDGISREQIDLGAALPRNDYGNGQRLRLYYGPDLRFVPRLGWFVWDGRIWQQDFDGLSIRRRAHRIAALIGFEAAAIEMPDRALAICAEADGLAEEYAALRALHYLKLTAEQATEKDRIAALMRDAKQARADLAEARTAARRHAKSAGNSNAVANMIQEASPYISTEVAAMNADPLAVCVENGVLQFSTRPAPGGEIETGLELVPHAREMLISKLMPVAYDPDARAPTFQRFLEDILPDPEMRGFLQRWFGYSISGLTTEQKLVFLYGIGRNGKSTLVDLIARIMGEYATSIPIETLTGTEQRKGADATPDLVRVPGARMIRASEPEEGLRFKEAMIKLLTGGEPIMIRRMREEFVEVKPEFKLTISGNHKPNVRGTDDGIWRRILLVPFAEQIAKDKVDADLGAKLWRERAGVLNWLIEGLRAVLETGLAEPEAVLEATAEFREDSDPVGVFLAQACDVTGRSEDELSARELIDGFNTWIMQREGKEWGGRTIANHLKNKAGTFRAPGGATFEPVKKSGSFYRGIRWAADFDPAPAVGGYSRDYSK